jgi:nucleoside-diphosphate-sugar epimerase
VIGLTLEEAKKVHKGFWTKNMTQAVLVTGGGGFLGKVIVKQLLAQGDKVTVLARGHYPELAQMGVQTIRGDIGEKQTCIEACKGVEIVYHVAAIAGISGTYNHFHRINTLGTQNIIAGCLAHGIQKLIYTSSPSVVFGDRPHRNADETVPYPTHYETPYAETKALGEQAALAANSRNLLTTSLRPHLIVGEGDNHLLPRLLQRARSGALIQVGDGTNKVDLTHVDDAARAHLQAAAALTADSPVAGQAYFISQGEPIVLWQWINEFLPRIGIPPVKRKISLSTARKIGGAMETIYSTFRLKSEPRLTRFLANELAKDHYYDISRAKNDFGYTPQLTMAQVTDELVRVYK